jgi:predicted Zn finger-like uncharacterized protein
MKVTCSTCQTGYRIADDRIPAGGARANCPNCGQQIVIEAPEKKTGATSFFSSTEGTDFGQTIAYDFSEVDQSRTEVTALLEEVSRQEPFFREGFSFALRDTGTGQKFPLQKPVITLGRKGGDINLNDPEVSRKHCIVKVFGDRFVIMDLKSTNGTFFEGRKVMTAKLVAGGKFRVGNTTLETVVKEVR